MSRFFVVRHKWEFASVLPFCVLFFPSRIRVPRDVYCNTTLHPFNLFWRKVNEGRIEGIKDHISNFLRAQDVLRGKFPEENWPLRALCDITGFSGSRQTYDLIGNETDWAGFYEEAAQIFRRRRSLLDPFGLA
jgi:hypothetical protein